MKTQLTLWPPRRTTYLLVLALVHYGMISTVSHVPGETLMATGIRIWDKLAHLIEYVPLGYVICLWGALRLKQVPPRIMTLATVLVVLSLGALDEFHQSFVPGRSPSAYDLLADSLGGALGAVLAQWTVRGRRSKQDR